MPSCIIVSTNYFLPTYNGRMSLLSGMYGHSGHYIIHEEEINRRKNTAIAYDPKEHEFLKFCPIYAKRYY